MRPNTPSGLFIEDRVGITFPLKVVACGHEHVRLCTGDGIGRIYPAIEDVSVLLEATEERGACLIREFLVPETRIFVRGYPDVVRLHGHVSAFPLDLVLECIEEAFKVSGGHPGVVELVNDDVCLSLIGVPVPATVVACNARNCVVGCGTLSNVCGFTAAGITEVDVDTTVCTIREGVEDFSDYLVVM